jgi:hypothetical protein
MINPLFSPLIDALLLGGFAIITLLMILSAYTYIRRERNVRNSNSDSSGDSLNGEDV